MGTSSVIIPTVKRMDPADTQILQDSVNNITTVLAKYGVPVSVQGRRSLAKLGPRRFDSVFKMPSYMVASPQFLPPFVKMDEYQAAVSDFSALRTLLQPLKLAVQVLGDIVMLTGAEAYSMTLSCYNSVRQAAKAGEYSAEKIYLELAPSFTFRSSKTATAAKKASTQASKGDAFA